MAQSVVLRARGIHSFKNSLSEIPEGAFEDALNVIIDRDGVVEPRRGFKQFSEQFVDLPKQILNYKDSLLVHQGSTLSFETDPTGDPGVFDNFSGTFVEVSPGRRIRGIESNGNFYFTTSEGVQKISALAASDFTTAAGFITPAGGIKALDVEAVIDKDDPGFFEPLSKVAYRVVWGITDLNDNLILGSPSSRVVIENPDTVNSGTVNLKFSIPTEIGTNPNYFYQVYRTALSVASPFTLEGLANAEVQEEYRLVFEDFPTNAELISVDRVVEVVDITPEENRRVGPNLYTNAQSGEGIIQSNEPPPFAQDIEAYKGYTFYANTSTRQQRIFTLLGIPDFVSESTKLFISDGVTENEYTFVGDFESYDLDFTGITKADLDGNFISLASSSDQQIYKIWFNNGSATEPTLANSIPIEVDISAIADNSVDLTDQFVNTLLLNSRDFNVTGTGTSITVSCANNGPVTFDVSTNTTVVNNFVITADGNGVGEDASNQEIFLPRIPAIGEDGPTPGQQIDQAARSIVKVINRNPDSIVNAFYLSGFEDVGGEILLQQKDLTGPQFRIYMTTEDEADQFNPILGVQTTDEFRVVSNNEARPNRIFYSKFQQPEAVPLVNFIDIGPRDEAIQRIIALRDSLFIFKEDGIYRLSGDVAPFSIAPFDFSLILQAPDTAVVLNNQVHAFTTQGVVQVTDTGVSVISRDIENLLLSVTRNGFNFETASFAISYEADRSYLLFTVSDSADTFATQCFRFNSFTNTWVRWNLAKTCGIVNERDNRIYLGASDTEIIEQERKALDRTDYADREFTTSIVTNGVNVNNLTLPNLTNIEIGDVLIQEQLLTIAQFNRLLNQLDRDPGVAESNYFTILQALPGSDLRVLVNSLANKLDNDAGVTDDDYLASLGGIATPLGTRDDFNVIVNKLNSDAGVFFVNYDISSGTTPVEAVIQELITDPINTVRINFTLPFVQGELTHFKAINCRVTYAPQIFGNPTTHKQVREGTFLFENNNFSQAVVGYKSDLSPFIEDISFSGSGVGDWGQFVWGNQNWGGLSGARPLRTLVPLQKQRCRFLQPEFRHRVAFEKWSLFGIGLEVREFSTRAYR